MRVNITTKLFFGFLIVVCFNVFYFVIIIKIDNINSITQILKKQHEIKNDLLRLKTLHRVRGPSVISYDRLGRAESVANFREMNEKIISLRDTVYQRLDSIRKLDSIILRNDRAIQTSDGAFKLGKVVDSIFLYNTIYYNTFDSIVIAKSKKQSEKTLKVKWDVLGQADIKLSSLLDSAEVFIDNQTNVRLKDVETRVREIKRSTYIIISVAFLFAVLLSYLVSRIITNPLRRLKDDASTIGRGDYNVDPHGYPNDEIGDLASAFFDMSIDLKNKEEELIKSKRMAAIGEVIASVNHEINNPLMIISGNAQFLELIMEGYPLEMRERVRTILEETERISKVTRKLREIRNPIVEDYTSSGEQMINLDKSSSL